MKTLTPLLLVFIFLFSCSRHHGIEGELKGLESDSLTVEYLLLSQPLDLPEADRDTLYPVDGKFVFDPQVDEPVLLIFDPKMAKFERIDGGYYRNHLKFIPIIYKPGDQISIHGEVKAYYTDYTAMGSTINEQYSLLRQEYVEEISEAARITFQIDSLAAIPGNDSLIGELYKQRRQFYKLENDKQLEYVKSNLESELSAYYLSRQRPEVVAQYYPLLSEDIRRGIFKTWLEEKLESYKWEMDIKEAKRRTQEGAIAPDFLLESMLGTIFSLDSVKKDFVVLDFWGSWCSPCVAGFPKMKEYYEKYHEEVEFIGIACYETDDAWKKSIKENDANWMQLINREKSENDVVLSYGVRNFPTKLILDKDRRIISRSKGEADIFYETLDELMKPE